MNPRGRLLLWFTITACAIGCTQEPEKTKMNSDTVPPEKSKSPPPSPIAVTSAASGKVMLLDRGDLSLLRTVESEKSGSSLGPMLVVEDKVRRVFYVGNFNGGLGRIPMDGSKPSSLDLGGVLIGVAISPDGRLLAVNGAHDLTLRLVDLDSWKVATSYRFGTPTDTPIHSPLTHGMASTHPVWLRDGSGVLVQDNIHEEVVLIGRDGKEKARLRLRTAAHSFLTTSTAEILALVEGTIDGKILPGVVVLDGPSLKIVREITVPLVPDEPAKLHHGSLSPDGEIVVVANMGPMHGENFGTTVAALQWRTGKVLWNVPTVRNAGHVRFLDAERVIVLGHRDANLAILDVKTGKQKETWKVPGATSLGHSLAEESSGTVLVIDSSAGRLVRVASDGIKNQSPNLGKEVSEASLPE
jgi:WD40 repeat protein